MSVTQNIRAKSIKAGKWHTERKNCIHGCFLRKKVRIFRTSTLPDTRGGGQKRLYINTFNGVMRRLKGKE